MSSGQYRLRGNQCDNNASRILTKGGKGYTVMTSPNSSFATYSRVNELNAYFRVEKGYYSNFAH